VNANLWDVFGQAAGIGFGACVVVILAWFMERVWLLMALRGRKNRRGL
jgi:hypothetical protein